MRVPAILEQQRMFVVGSLHHINPAIIVDVAERGPLAATGFVVPGSPAFTNGPAD